MQVAPTTEELLEIHGRIRACVACRLHVTRTQAVPGYGPVEARIMAVGEAPGEKEDQQGRPSSAPRASCSPSSSSRSG